MAVATFLGGGSKYILGLGEGRGDMVISKLMNRGNLVTLKENIIYAY